MQPYVGEGACGQAVGVAQVLAGFLLSSESMGLSCAEVESRVEVVGREILRLMVQGHLDERAAQERRVGGVVDADGVVRGRVERGHRRRLGTVFGPVTVTRLAYRAPAVANLYPADEGLNLPVGLHSFVLRRRVLEQVVAGSFDAATDAVQRACGVRVGKRQAQALTVAAAQDVAGFYAQRLMPPDGDGDVLVLTLDGKGVVMLPQGLRDKTRRIAAAATPKMLTRLASGEKRGRKRIAQVGGVYDCVPVPRTPAEIISMPGQAGPPRRAGPKASGKWLTASLVDGIEAATATVFNEAYRRDPDQKRPWVVLVDGNVQQLDQIQAESARRGLPVTIVCDFVHVLEYLWKAAHGFYRDGDQAAETWVAVKARQILSGHVAKVIADIAAEADAKTLTGTSRRNTDTTITYLINKTPHLDYPTALDNGWPIATGVIEGACRHLVKDRMDITGARWGLTGAEAVLTLRAVAINGDLDEYWTYHLQQEHHRNHKTRYLNHHPPTRTTH